MQITDVKIRKLFDNAGPMKAVASITLDNQFAVHDIKIINTNGKVFVVMPSRRNQDGSFKDIAHPINAEFRTVLENKVIDAFNEAVAAKEAEESASSCDIEISQ